MISNTAETGYYALTPEEARQERDAGRQEGRQEGQQEVLAMLSEAERDKIRQRLVSKTTSQNPNHSS